MPERRTRVTEGQLSPVVRVFLAEGFPALRAFPGQAMKALMLGVDGRLVALYAAHRAEVDAEARRRGQRRAWAAARAEELRQHGLLDERRELQEDADV